MALLWPMWKSSCADGRFWNDAPNASSRLPAVPWAECGDDEEAEVGDLHVGADPSSLLD
jgi:hypothetical protein